jgi:hypothetical protein
MAAKKVKSIKTVIEPASQQRRVPCFRGPSATYLESHDRQAAKACECPNAYRSIPPPFPVILQDMFPNPLRASGGTHAFAANQFWTTKQVSEGR